MASNETVPAEKFINPMRGLYSTYSITVEDFKKQHPLLLDKYELKTVSDTSRFEVYSLFNEDGDGELMRDKFQTWICDHRLEADTSIRSALKNKNLAFCNWFRDSEKFESPDELILYFVGKITGKHVIKLDKT